MSRIGLAIVLTAAFAAAILPSRLRAQEPDAAVQSEVERAVRAAHAEMKAAAERRDVAGLYRFVIDGPAPIIEDGRLRGSVAEARQITEQGFQGVSEVSYRYARDQVMVLSPTSAVWVGAGTTRVVLTDGREISAPFAETIVFVLRDGTWKVLHAHRSAPNV